MFKKDFIWGAATASAQIEGGYASGDRSPSIWDKASEFTTSNFIYQNNTTFNACNHFEKWKEDVALMKQIGLKAYRFSLSWSRLIPSGDGEVSQEGAKFYNDLIDELISNGIEPFVTLFHWDYPQVLQDRGGWQNPQSPIWFEHYAMKVAQLFSDRVKFFITLNEPEVYVNDGYLYGDHAPFYKLPAEVVFSIAHNILKANALGFHALKNNAKQTVQVGQAHCVGAKIPYTDSEQDVSAAKAALFEGGGVHFWDSYFMDAIMRGEYVANRLASLGSGIKYNKDDLKLICIKPDFLGFNTYTGDLIKMGQNGTPQKVAFSSSTDFTAMNWAVDSRCLYYNAKFLYERYKLPLYITENGVALAEIPNAKNQVNDDSRIEYIRTHLLSLNKAIEEGADVRGYFYWSLMDNFEWAHGYSKRFGLIRVNFETFERTLKKSANWYKKVISTCGGNLGENY